jgi:hypothetical protein
MRRLLVPSVLVLTFLALGAWSGSAGAIVCPEATDNVTCCGPVTPNPGPPSGCCPASCCSSASCCGGGAAEPACPVVQLTISSSPDPSVAGRRVTISGGLAGASSGTAVDLWQELPGQSSFHRVAQTTTNSSGRYAFARGAGVVETNTSWYTTSGGATSRTLVQQVGAVVQLQSSSAHPATGKAVTLSGRVSPAHAGERILLQKRTKQGWRTIASTALGSGSRFALRHRFAHSGTLVLRALLRADRRNTQSASSALPISVR